MVFWCSFQTEELDEWWCMSHAWDFSVMLEILQWPFDMRSHHAGQTRLLIRQATSDFFMFSSKWLESWICCFRKGMLGMLKFVNVGMLNLDLQTTLITRWNRMKPWKKMQVYHESIIWIYESWYVCSRSAKDFYLREKEAQVVGKTFINQAKQDSLDQLTFFAFNLL